MPFPIFVFFIAGVIWLHTFMRRADRKKAVGALKLREYLKAEHEANFSKARNIDENLFLNFDISAFTLDTLGGDGEILAKLKAKEKTFVKASEKKMLRFGENLSNREIKEMFGAANFELAVQYEQNLTNFFISANFYAESLIEHNRTDLAISLLQFLKNNGSDLSRTYTLLADALFKKNDMEKLKDLLNQTKVSNMNMKDKITDHINGLLNERGDLM